MKGRNGQEDQHEEEREFHSKPIETFSDKFKKLFEECRIKKVGFLLFIFTFQVLGMVPVEGILMGEAAKEYQQDPLSYIFSNIYDQSNAGENAKIKLYLNTYINGRDLDESCSLYAAPIYANPWQEKQARRTITANLQYVGLDTSIKAIGAYSKFHNLSDDQFQKLSGNLVKNYCSKNITVFSLRSITEALKFSFKNAQMQMIPTIESSPFATAVAKLTSSSPIARSQEFHQAIKNFRAFCSWGGDPEDYRMLVPYLSNRFIMSFVFKNMAGVQSNLDPELKKVFTRPDYSTVQVNCTDQICRKESLAILKTKFPYSIGSTGLETDLSKQYCHHFKFQDYSKQKTIPEVKDWIKKAELEDPIFETSFFISLMTGVPEFTMGAGTYQGLILLSRSGLDTRWNLWSTRVLASFSRDLLFEESIKVKSEPQTIRPGKNFGLNFSVTLGELDRVTNDSDKLKLSFELKLSKNYLRSIKSKWIYLENEVDFEGQKVFKAEVARYIDVQLKEKEKLFKQRMWNNEFSKFIVEELLTQTLNYRGPMFDSYQDEILDIPVRFSYGLFALSYLRYRSEVTSGRLKLNL